MTASPLAAATSSIDILSTLTDVMGSILGSKVDMGLSANLPFTETVQRMDANEKLLAKMTADVKKQAEKDRQLAIETQLRASGGAGTNIKAPARIRNRI